MSRLLFILTAAVALVMSCARSGEHVMLPAAETAEEFSASFAQTRTSLDGTAVVWNDDDCITIFTKTSHNRKYSVKELSEDGRTATFGYVSFTGSNSEAITSNYALYPHHPDASISGGTITTTLDATQTYRGVDALHYALMASKSEDNDFAFVNAGALVRFKLSKIVPDAFTLQAIRVTSAENNIAGEVIIDCSSGDYTATVTENGVKEITLEDINTEITLDPQSFYVAMLATDFAKDDLTVTFQFAEGQKSFTLPAFSLAQGTIKTIAYEINDAEDFTGSMPDSGDTAQTESKRSLSILFVGNSLTQDGIAYLPYMLKNYYPEVDFKIYMWYIGGKTLAEHYSNFIGSRVAEIFSVAENSESWTNYKKSKSMASVLSSYTFDIVCLQEYFNYKTSYEDCSDWNNCRDYIVSHYKGGNALKFISLFHAPLRKSGYDVNEVYKRTEAGNALILQNTISEDIIPVGIAVYKALDTELNMLGDLGQLTPDGTHTQEGLPCLLQTYVALCWLFDRFDINKSVYGHPMRITEAIYNKISVPGANLGSGVVQGTDAHYLLAQEVAIQAYKEGKQLLAANLYKCFSIATNVEGATIKINGVEQSAVTVVAGSTVNWEVAIEGYHTQSGSEVVQSDTILFVELLPVVEVESLTALFTQGQRTIFDEQELDDLRRYLVVTANYADGTNTLTDNYVLSGTLHSGTSSVTVSFGGQTTTFDVEVTEVVIPEEYTRYGWVATKDDTSPDSKVSSYFIYLNAYEDMNLLCSEFILGEKPNVQRANPGVCGARLASGDGYHWYGLYMQDDGVRVDLRAGGSKVAYPADRHRFKLVVDNPPTSPCSATINDGEATTTREWTSSPVIPYAMSLFNNIPNGATSKMSFNFSTRIGDIIFRDYEGRCVGFYVPVTYQGKIGMFDVITQTFCTAKTASAVTISNSGCLYKVGNW